MMAFYTTYQENGAKRFHPTPDLEKVLEQDRIKEADLKAFRSSNRVEDLLKKVLQKRGFSHDYQAREWVRIDAKPKPKSSVFDWAQEKLNPFANSKLGMPFMLADMRLQPLKLAILQKSRPITEKELFFLLENGPAVKALIGWLKEDGWSYYVDTRDWRPPKVKWVADRVYEAMAVYQMQFGVLPNKLWISNQEWHELTYKENPYSGGAHSGGVRMYQGMKVELMAPGTKLFVGTAADEHVAAEDPVVLHTGQAVTFKAGKLVPAAHGDESIGVAEEIFDQEGKLAGKVYFRSHQAGKTEKMFQEAYGKGMLDGAKTITALDKIQGRKPKVASHSPSPTKKIIPPSQLKRKLAL